MGDLSSFRHFQPNYSPVSALALGDVYVLHSRSPLRAWRASSAPLRSLPLARTFHAQSAIPRANARSSCPATPRTASPRCRARIGDDPAGGSEMPCPAVVDDETSNIRCTACEVEHLAGGDAVVQVVHGTMASLTEVGVVLAVAMESRRRRAGVSSELDALSMSPKNALPAEAQRRDVHACFAGRGVSRAR